MRLHEAIESGKPFRKESWTSRDIWWDSNLVEFHALTEDYQGQLICATDWILKYDCETCKDTKKIIDFGSTGKDAMSHKPCPDCATPKYKCETCKDTKNIPEIVVGGRPRPCPECSVPKMKKITVYRPIFLYDDTYFRQDKWYKSKSDVPYDGVVGWDEEEIEVVEQ